MNGLFSQAFSVRGIPTAQKKNSHTPGLVWAEMGWAWWINPAGGGKERGGSIGLGLIESNPTVWPSSHNS